MVIRCLYCGNMNLFVPIIGYHHPGVHVESKAVSDLSGRFVATVTANYLK